MKVATLTLPLHSNYGGIIQAYALQKAILSLGHDSELINLTQSVYSNPVRAFLSDLKQKAKPKKNDSFSNFIENEILLSRKVKYSFQLNNGFINKYDAYIVGSDQVWRKDYAKNLNLFFFGSIKDKKSKKFASYAASFGKGTIDYSQVEKNECSSLLGNFDLISVRESGAQEIVLNEFQKESRVLLDPTMIIEREHYDSIIQKYKTNDEFGDKVFCYFLDPNNEKEKIANKVSDLMSCNYGIFNNGLDKKRNFGDWLNGFKSSRFVITDSFHGVVFSILYNKEFIAIGNAQRGLDRFKTILNRFNLSDRLILSNEEFTDELLYQKIDYSSINVLLKKNKKEAINALVDFFSENKV